MGFNADWWRCIENICAVTHHLKILILAPQKRGTQQCKVFGMLETSKQIREALHLKHIMIFDVLSLY